VKKTKKRVPDDLAKTALRPTLGARADLLAAGEVVISSKGFARATVEEIAEKAGVDADVFYALFQGKGALLRALNEQFVKQLIAAIDEATQSGTWSSASAGELLEVAVRSILDVVMEKQGLVRAFLAHGATDRSLADGLRRIGTHLTERVTVSLGECKDAPAANDKAIAFSLLLSVALAHHSILVGDEWSGISFTRQELTHELARAIGAYLALDA
jgi:AcrR family transcriptional regulator